MLSFRSYQNVYKLSFVALCLIVIHTVLSLSIWMSVSVLITECRRARGTYSILRNNVSFPSLTVFCLLYQTDGQYRNCKHVVTILWLV